MWGGGVSAAAAMGARSATSGAAAGLVPSKTTHPARLLPFGSESSRQRRIARMRRGVWGAGHWLQRSGRAGWRCWFVTLTYRPGLEWQPNHVQRALVRLRKWCALRAVMPRYVWVAELQQRGALHYHVAVWLPRSLALPKWDKAGWWPHGMTQRALAIAPIGYLMKYVSKGDTPFHKWPKGVRIYGTGGLCQDARDVRAWLNLPEWAKAKHGVGEVRRLGSAYLVRATGEILESPWRVERVPGGLSLQLTGELAPRWFAGPYSRLNQCEELPVSGDPLPAASGVH